MYVVWEVEWGVETVCGRVAEKLFMENMECYNVSHMRCWETEMMALNG